MEATTNGLLAPVGIGLSIIVLIVLYLLSCMRVLNEYERFRLGRAQKQPRDPGLLMVFWPVDKMLRVG